MRILIGILKIILLVVIVTMLLAPVYLWIMAAITPDVADASAGTLAESAPGEPIPDLARLIPATLAYGIMTSVMGAFIHTLISFGLAYSLARGKFPLRDELKLITLLALLLPATVLLGPLYWLNFHSGLGGYFAATFIAMWTVPWLTLILYLYLARLPQRMELYANLDGLTSRQILTQLILPYSFKGLIAVFLLSFLFNFHSLFAAAISLPAESFSLDTKVSFSYLPEMISLFEQPPTVISSSHKMLAALAWQAPSIVILPLLIIFGIPVIQTITTGRYVYRRKLSVFGRQLRRLASTPDKL